MVPKTREIQNLVLCLSRLLALVSLAKAYIKQQRRGLLAPHSDKGDVVEYLLHQPALKVLEDE
jgi:hypothetical protein